MVDDVVPFQGLVNGVKPLAAARLCNFRSGEHGLRDTHQDWITETLKPALLGSPNPWVDIIAYASRKGTNTGYDNQGLSERRRAAVHAAILAAVPRAGLIKLDKALGSSVSGGDANNNDGYWRAVEVYAYGELPKKREPDPKPPPPKPAPAPPPPPLPPPDWWVTSLSVGGFSFVLTVGGGYADGTIGFENMTSGETVTDKITIGGISIGDSAGIDKIKKVAELLKKNVFVEKALKWVINSLSGGKAEWKSWAAGPVWPMPGHSNLTNADFRGTCFSIFVTSSVPIGSAGFYVIFMGKQETFAAFMAWVAVAAMTPGIGAAAMASSIMSNSHAIAVVPAVAMGVSPTVGVSLNAWAGRIS